MSSEQENRLRELEKKSRVNDIRPMVFEVRFDMAKKQYQYQNKNYWWTENYDELPEELIINSLGLDEKSLGYRALIIFGETEFNDDIQT